MLYFKLLFNMSARASASDLFTTLGISTSFFLKVLDKPLATKNRIEIIIKEAKILRKTFFLFFDFFYQPVLVDDQFYI